MVEGWEKVRFNHDPTGFPLRGAHVDVTCNGCHSQGFDKPVADTCSGCHRDRHASEFGLHCEGCHDEKSWRPLFNADAHRSTNFPLVGRHALIPCTECHGNVRDRVFAQAAVRCDACHEADLHAHERALELGRPQRQQLQPRLPDLPQHLPLLPGDHARSTTTASASRRARTTACAASTATPRCRP